MSALLQYIEAKEQEALLKSHFFIVIGSDCFAKGAKLYPTKEEALEVAKEKLQQNPQGRYYILESVACVKCDFPVTVVDLKEKKETEQ